MIHHPIAARRAPVRRAGLSDNARLARIAAPVLLLAALAACGGENPTGAGEPQADSSIRFDFSGSGPDVVLQGTYEAQGAPRPGTDLIDQTYAMGHRYAGAGAIQVMSNRKRDGGTADFAWVTLPRLSAGAVSVDRSCGTDTCPGVLLALEVGSAHGSQARYSCSLEAGTLRITSISSSRAKGEFSGTGICVGAPGTDDLPDFRITNGQFDVKLTAAQG